MTSLELIQFRYRNKLSQTQCALALGCHRNSIRAWELGRTEIPKYIALAASAYVYGLPPMGIVVEIKS